MNLRYVLVRLVRVILTLYVVATVVFFILKMAPGSPLSQYISPAFDQKQIEILKHQFGLDQPLHIQYFRYLGSISTLKFGRSLAYKQDVIKLIGARLPNTLLVLVPMLILTYVIGVSWGMVAGWKRGGKFEIGSLVVVLIGRAAPPFWVGLMAISVFAFKLGWLPSGGIKTPGYYYHSFWEMALSGNTLLHLILPIVTYSFFLIGLPFLVMRMGMLENLSKDYILMHRYFGLPERKIMFRAGRNAILPVLTVIALGIGYIFEGSPVVETVFGWPGIGLLLVNAVTARDYPLAQACFLIIATSILVMNFIADFLYGVLDPRISAGRRFK
jgi:peptide/nickel transport system permease protein